MLIVSWRCVHGSTCGVDVVIGCWSMMNHCQWIVPCASSCPLSPRRWSGGQWRTPRGVRGSGAVTKHTSAVFHRALPICSHRCTRSVWSCLALSPIPPTPRPRLTGASLGSVDPRTVRPYVPGHCPYVPCH